MIQTQAGPETQNRFGRRYFRTTGFILGVQVHTRILIKQAVIRVVKYKRTSTRRPDERETTD